MAIYLIALIEIHDRQRYAKYEAGFMEIFARYSGRMRAVDERVEVLEGDWPATRTVLVEFPDKDAALAWYRSDEYQQLAEHRYAASVASIALVAGFPDAD